MKILNDLPLGTFDLHIHTTASDGRYRPAEILDLATKVGLKTISITDHDTLDGLREAISLAPAYDLTVIPGVEISTRWQSLSIDILGYNIRDLDLLHSRLAEFRENRKERAKKIIEKFCRLGMPITLEDVKKISGNGIIARPHIAQAIVVKGYAYDTKEVFNHYLGDGKPADVSKKELPLPEGIRMIREAGGVAVLAHPGYLKNHELIEEIILMGIDGIEVWHRQHGKREAKKFLQMAEQHDLIVTGGSDFHHDEHALGHFR
ncbi:PHP domain-containing protein [Thermoactinomyces sp. CICC 10523]|uniref:PHP domain-containing protein n=1 Tax=Thermoactinomyces sp. CICC 10523 TaxID=2767428 RepID=UPI0018DD17C5|nr:PHP domain-containing protein [Thermoactinomyces sp. CICC 10523]MBH8598407.1 PHP domain-containing protein [Thermoactinomyces sp. CICC 10523]